MAETYENIYGYDASLSLALCAAAIFCVISFLHTYQMIRSRAWLFVAFVTGAYFETFGYLVRAFSIHERPEYTLVPYAASLAMILVAPALLAASIYMSLGRIIRLIQAEHHSIVRIGWLTKIFILGDVASFVTQAMGAVVLSQHEEDSLSKGSNIVIIGPAIQIVFFGLFLVTAIVFHVRTNRHPTDRSRHPDIPWRRHVWVLYAASAIILIRCLFRFIEYRDISSSEKSYLATKEWPNYIFDALLMLVVLILFFVYHPSEITALRRPRGGVAMKYLHAHLVGPINDHWRSLPQPNLGPKVMYQHGDQIARMSMHAPRNVRLAKEAIRGP